MFVFMELCFMVPSSCQNVFVYQNVFHSISLQVNTVT